MSDYLVREGIDTWHAYGVETTSGTKASSINKNVGLTQNFNFNINRNIVRPRGAIGYLVDDNTKPTSRDAQSILKGTFEGSLSLSFQPSNFRFMESVLGSESGSGTTAAPYVYPQASGSTNAEKLKYVRLPSLTWSTNALYDGTNDNADGGVDLLGCKIGSCDIRAAMGEPVSVSLTVPFKDINPRHTLDTGVPIENEDVYHFTGCDVEIPSDESITNIINDFTLTVNNGTNYRHGIGSDKPKAIFAGNREFTLNLNLTSEGLRWVKAIGAFTIFESITLKFEGDDDRTFEIELFNCGLDSNNVQGSHPNPVDEQLTVYPTHAIAREVIDASEGGD